MIFEPCFKCGQKKLASINWNNAEDHGLTVENTEMVMMGYGKNRNQFCCKNCKVPSKYFDPVKEMEKEFGRRI